MTTQENLDKFLELGLEKTVGDQHKTPQKNFDYYFLRTEELTKEVKELEIDNYRLKQNINGVSGSISDLKRQNRIMRKQLENLGCDVATLLKSATSTTTPDVGHGIMQDLGLFQPLDFNDLSTEQLFGYQSIKEAHNEQSI